MSVCACVGEVFVRVAFGEAWLDAVPILQVLAVYGIVCINFGTATSILIALDRARLASILSAVRLACQIPLLVTGAMIAGAIGAAYAMLIAALIRLALNSVVLKKLLNFSTLRMLRAAWRSFLASGLMAVAITSIQLKFFADPSFGEALFQLTAMTVLGAAIYVSTIIALWALCGFPNGPGGRSSAARSQMLACSKA